MKRLLIGISLLACGVLFLGEALAIGVWRGGLVTQQVWTERNLRRIVIDDVRYTIMPDAIIQYAYKSEGATYKKPLDASALRKGDEVIVRVEGNRIYEIERTR